MALELKQVESALTHDLNNFLQVILGNLELLKRRGELAPEIVEAALAATRHAAMLADRLGAIGRLRRQELRSLEVNRLLAELAPLLERTVGAAIRVELKLASDVPQALADPQSLQLALLELTTNAHNAMPAGGRLSITTAEAGGFVRISFADTGCGMPPRTKENEAEPTGLGLAIVEHCMALAGGRMELDSTDMGTTVKLYLPVAL